jgi:uncharacterized protein (DUF3084 family)
MLLALVGAVVAYTGDLLGRRMGKKRVTIGKLRPKHTAILITSVTGFLISGVTALALFLSVPAINVAVVKGESLIRDNIELARNLKLAKASEADFDRRLAEKSNLLTEATTQASMAVAKVELSQKRVDALDGQLKGKQLQLQTVEAEVINLKATKTKLEKWNNRLVSTNEHLAGENYRLTEQINKNGDENYRLVRDIGDKNRQLAAFNKQLAALVKVESELKGKNAKLQGDLEEKQKQYADLEKKILQVASGTDEVVTALAEKTNECNALRTANADLKAENSRQARVIDSFGAITKQIAGDYDRLRTDRIAIHRGEDLARVTIPAQSAPDVVRKQVQALLSEAHLAALSKGASLGTGARAIEFDSMVPQAEDSTAPMSEDDYIDAIVRSVEWSPSPVCILAEAVQNTRQSAPAKINFRPYTNRLVYGRNQKLGSRRIDSSMPPAQIVDELVEFVKETGQVALNKGMIPRFDGTGEPQVGSLSTTEIATLMDEIRNVGRAARISAWTSRDIYSSDKLELRFRVDPGP